MSHSYDKFQKRFRDTYGDTITVGVDFDPNMVYLDIQERHETAQIELTSEQAKDLRKALKKAIAAAEEV